MRPPYMPRLTGKVLVAPVSALWAAGFPMDADPWSNCLACGCPAGLHEAVVPSGTTPFSVLLLGGRLECPGCRRGCGTWTIALPDDGS